MNKLMLNYTLPLTSNIKYGYLYNWFAITDVRYICASGWHIPTHAEYITLGTYIGGTTYGGTLKETGLTYWDDPNTDATNSNKFNARGGGYRSAAATPALFYYLKAMGLWWTSTVAVNPDDAQLVLLFFDSGAFNYALGNNHTKKSGLPVRLLKDSTTLAHGRTGIYVGNDGKIYPTICIGTQEFTSYNLCETKYRNNDDITTVTDGTDWYNLTTEAKCAYNNDLNNI